MGQCMPAQWYDEAYKAAVDTYQRPYYDSHYKPLWQYCLDKYQPRKGLMVDVGCGTGQCSHFYADHKVKPYIGLDFSRWALEFARQRCPRLTFVESDVERDLLLAALGPQCFVVSSETLEHLANDLAVLGKIPGGTHVAFTVPCFDDPAHVRHFANVDEVSRHYDPVVDILECVVVAGSYFGTYGVIR